MSLRIYLAEDSPILCKLLRELITGQGMVIAGEADTAARAIEGIAKARPDVAIIDLSLRVGDGFEVLRAIPNAQAPVRIVLTNHGNPGFRTAASEAGADYFFDKANQIHEMIRLLVALPAGRSRVNGAPNI